MDRDSRGRFIAGNKYRWSSEHQPVNEKCDGATQSGATQSEYERVSLEVDRLLSTLED